ncbi:vancomycin high temperature exclusion protein [Streptomyces sp. NPDC092296]|uniref:SanA/YdcF family protein n=1 Tax=Streptomyces sp. NPDC092296 TaxID=3366012 RepID=UPI003825E599
MGEADRGVVRGGRQWLGRLRTVSAGWRLPATRRARRRALRVLVVLCVAVLTPATWLWLDTGGRVRTVATAPAEPVAVVFGAGLDAGRPSPYLANRLDAAVRLYRQGTVRAILVTGDNSRTGYDEPTAMRDYLRGHGVPEGQVVLDYAGFDTWDSCTRARRIFGVRRALLVSQDFHIRRAIALCRAAGIDSYGVGVSEPHDATWYYGGVREVAAATKAALEAAVRPDPHVLGPAEPGVTRALERSGRR